MATPSNTFEYRPLEDPSRDIRLLNILPSEPHEPLALQIFHARLDVPEPSPTHKMTVEQLRETLDLDAWEVVETAEERYIFYDLQTEQTQWHHPDPDFDRALYEWQDPYLGLEPVYEALSYTWGIEEATELVSIENIDSVDDTLNEDRSADNEMCILLRPNLREALMALRQNEMPRVFWVDAICIDQGNTPEKNKQVQRMGSIYKLAHRVVVWLGTASPDGSSAVALEILRTLSTQQQRAKKAFIPLPHPDTHDPQPYDAIIKTTEDALKVQEFLGRPWFDRLWVRQEICLANPRAVVYCGSDTILWTQLRLAIIQLLGMIIMHGSDIPFSHSGLDSRFGLAIFVNDRRIEELIEVTDGVKFGVPHDRIIAILSLADSTNLKITADYDKPFFDWIQDVFLTVLECYDDLCFLELCKTETNQPGTPSWIPNVLSPVTRILNPAYFMCHASGSARYLGQGKLEVAGIMHGSVQSLSERIIFNIHHPNELQVLIREWDARSLTSPKEMEGRILRTFGDAAFWICETFIKTSAHGKREETYSWETVLGDKTYMWLVWNLLLEKRLFETEDCVGVCREGTETGDILTTLLSLPSPLLLRPVPNSNPPTHTLISNTYVPTLTYGEALLGPLHPTHSLICLKDTDARERHVFTDLSTNTESYDDPRKGLLEEFVDEEGVVGEWAYDERFDVWGRAEPWYRNKSTGEITARDPRMSKWALEKRGVVFERIVLV